jgi:hypothetical protein
VRISRTVLRGAGGEIPGPTHQVFTASPRRAKSLDAIGRETYFPRRFQFKAQGLGLMAGAGSVAGWRPGAR